MEEVKMHRQELRVLDAKTHAKRQVVEKLERQIAADRAESQISTKAESNNRATVS